MDDIVTRLRSQVDQLRSAMQRIIDHHESQRTLWADEFGETDMAEYHEERRDFALFHLNFSKISYKDCAQSSDEIEQLRADAERYRRLGCLVDFGDWSVIKNDIVDSYGHVNETRMDDRAHMDSLLDSPEVIADAEASRIAIEWHSATEETK